MTTIYDSRGFVKKLTEAGMPEGQADTLANENLLLLAEHLATKDDLRALATSLHAEMNQLRTELVGEMNALEARLVAKLGGRIIAVGGVIAALLAGLAAVVALR